MKTREETLKFINSLAQDIKSAGGRSFYVGGCVRDEILNRPCDDLDIEIYGLEASKLSNVLSKYGKQEIIGNAFGVFNVHGYDVDISLPRKDNKTGLKHTDFDVVVDPYMSFEEATARRDFTMNAIMKDVLTGEFVDVQNGIEDIKNKTIRHVSNEHFTEDPLRVLRATRFAAQLGFGIAEETKQLCKTIELKDLSPERILTETNKALSSDKPSIYFEELKNMDQLKYWFKELNDLVGLKQNPDYHLEDAFEHTMMVVDEGAKNKIFAKEKLPFMFACLCHDLGKATKTDPVTFKTIEHEFDSEKLSEKMLRRIKADNLTIKYVKELSRDHMEPGRLYNHLSADKKIIAMLDKSSYPNDLLLIKKCDREGAIPGPKFSRREDKEYDDWSCEAIEKFTKWKEKPHLKGEDLIAVGLKQGKEIGDILDRERKLEYSNSLEDAIRIVQKEFKIPKEKINAILESKGLLKETREAKMLQNYQSCGYCLNEKSENLTIREIVIKADSEIMKDFNKSGKDADEYFEFLKEKLGDNALKHQMILDNIEKYKSRG